MKYPNTVCTFGMYSKIPSIWHAWDQTGAGQSDVTVYQTAPILIEFKEVIFCYCSYSSALSMFVT